MECGASMAGTPVECGWRMSGANASPIGAAINKMNIQSRWQQIDEVVAAALELPREQRNAYVDSACGAGTALSTEVRALIRAYEEAGDFLNPVTHARKWSAIETESGNLDG